VSPVPRYLLSVHGPSEHAEPDTYPSQDAMLQAFAVKSSTKNRSLNSRCHCRRNASGAITATRAAGLSVSTCRITYPASMVLPNPDFIRQQVPLDRIAKDRECGAHLVRIDFDRRRQESGWGYPFNRRTIAVLW
jgi:hypothetical protein